MLNDQLFSRGVSWVGGGGEGKVQEEIVIFHLIALYTIGLHTFAHALVTMLAHLESL